MTSIQLLRLFHTIYYGRPPNIDFIQDLGLLAVKIGQTYAQRADFLPDASCRELARLYRHTTPIAPEQIDQLLRANTPKDWKDEFAEIDPHPLACASVGQVHRATLKSSEAVVVKVVRNSFSGTFERDVKKVRCLLSWLVRCYPKLARVADPIGTLDHIRASTVNELNLRNEVAGQQTLRDLYERYRDHYDLAKLRFPRIYPKLSNQNVMVSEWLSGPTFDELLTQDELRYESLLDLFQIHGFFLFCTGTFHGDLHPGNVILQNNDIFLLDTGAISQVDDSMRRGVFNFFDSVVSQNWSEAADALYSMSRSKLRPSALDNFREAFKILYQPFLGKTVSELSLTKQMMQTIRLAVDHGMNFETGMYPIIKSLMYLDGMALACAPNRDLMSDLKPFLDRFRPWVHDGIGESPIIEEQLDPALHG